MQFILNKFWIRAVLTSLLADYTDTACSRWLKQLIPIVRPIMTCRLLADILTENLEKLLFYPKKNFRW